MPDAFEALEVLMNAGCTRLLTSGLKKTAIEGATLIAELMTLAAGRIVIMPGGSVRSTNIAQLAAATQANEYHSSGIISMAQSQVADPQEVRAIVNGV